MNNKSLITVMAERTGISQKEVAALLETSMQCLVGHMQEDATFVMQGFGSLEVRRMKERRLVNPTTREIMVIPTKLSLAFKPGTTYKERLKNKQHDGQ